jgi:hypothetical protein
MANEPPPYQGTVDKWEDVLREPQHERFQSPSNKGFPLTLSSSKGTFRENRQTLTKEGEGGGRDAATCPVQAGTWVTE